jgi:hypothetical protein
MVDHESQSIENELYPNGRARGIINWDQESTKADGVQAHELLRGQGFNVTSTAVSGIGLSIWHLDKYHVELEGVENVRGFLASFDLSETDPSA